MVWWGWMSAGFAVGWIGHSIFMLITAVRVHRKVTGLVADTFGKPEDQERLMSDWEEYLKNQEANNV